MRQRRAGWAVLFAGGLSAVSAHAQEVAPPDGSASPPQGQQPAKPAGNGKPTTLDEVTVKVKRLSDTDERRFSTAAKIVYGREELDRYGDTALGDVLKRLPGVTLSGTPGRGGDIRMRGLGKGYTLILLNGEPVPRGFSMDSLAPEQVERIEIMRAPVAEHSSRAIAGIINIILREDFAVRENEARPMLTWEQGRAQPSAYLQHSDVAGNLNYSVNANVFEHDQKTEARTTTTAVDLTSGAPTLAQVQQNDSRTVSDGIHLGSRLNWKLAGGDTFTLQPFLMQSRSITRGDGTLDQSVGASPPPYSTAHWTTDADSLMLRAMGNWKMRLDQGARLEIRFNGGMANSDSTTSRNEYDDGAPSHTALNSSGIHDANFSTAGKYSLSPVKGHNVDVGWEAELGHRREDATTVQDGVLQLAQYGSSLEASTQRLAGYGQDEWDVSPLWSLYGGVRWEGIHTRSDWAGNSIGNDSSVLSPLLHSVWRFSEESKDQIRLGLTRSYNSPTLAQLVPRPTLSAVYPASGGNTATNPDTSGNPALKPELARGVDLAYEHYLSDGGLLSANLFQRDIENLIRSVTSLQNVSWSPVPRWVTTPQNFSRAVARGLELEAKFSLSELMAGAPPLDVRANFSRFWSQVEDVPGPNNRLDQQPWATGNLGLDYRMRSLPLTLGGNLNWTPAFSVQQTAADAYSQGLKRVYDAYALWRFDPDTRLRLSVSNLLHADYDTSSSHISGTIGQFDDTVTKTYVSWTARLEMKF